MTFQYFQNRFSNGSIPRNLNGFYKGKLRILVPKSTLEHIGNFVFKLWLPWYGKEFDSKGHTGSNRIPLFAEPLVSLRFGDQSIVGKTDGALRVFPFKTSVENALRDNMTVLKLNYDLPQNPQSVRNVVDELVDVGKNEYLGKAYQKEGSNLRLTAFFSLKG